MPRYPDTSSTLQDVAGAVYSALAARLATYAGETYPLHVGDTWLEPAVGCRMQDLSVDDHPGMHRYAPPRGLAGLIDAVAARVEGRSGVPTAPDEILVAAGATGALGAVLGAIVEPGDDVLILAPYWPLISGIVRCFHGAPIAVPTIGAVDSADASVAACERARTSRTVALYLSTPNNPTGRVLPPEWVRALAGWAASAGLWIVADEVYEDYVYEGRHAYARAIAPDRTFAAHSFSKAFGMAGNRCGYVVGPRDKMVELSKVSTHSFYSTPTASQLAAERALDGRGDAWISDVRERYRAMGRAAAERLGVAAPEGSTFLFLDVAPHLAERGLPGFLERCAERGLLVAPGPSFGPYPTHVRVCFTCAPPDVVARGVDVLARLIGR
jgi:aspartate/methionine/tyrosine aminotransferase